MLRAAIGTSDPGLPRLRAAMAIALIGLMFSVLGLAFTAVVPLIETYLGSLPSRGAPDAETSRDLRAEE